MNPQQKNSDNAGREWDTSLTTGLSGEEAARRLQVQGKNCIVHTAGAGAGKMLLAQFRSLLVLILIGAAILSVLLGSYRDASILLLIVLFNTLIGFYQDLPTRTFTWASLRPCSFCWRSAIRRCSTSCYIPMPWDDPTGTTCSWAQALT